MPRDFAPDDTDDTIDSSHFLDCDTLVISDAHLGNGSAQAEYVLELLLNSRCKRLIINGDFIDFWDLAKKKSWRFSETELRILDVINQKIRDGVEVIYNVGNHEWDEFGTARVLGKNIGGIDFQEEIVEDGTRISHGHKYDPIDQKMGHFFHSLVSKIGFVKAGYHWAVRNLNTLNKSYRKSQLCEKVENFYESFERAKANFRDAMQANASAARQIAKEAEREGIDPRETKTAHRVHKKALEAAHRDGFDREIHGHTHTPGTIIREFKDGRRVELIDQGDMLENRTFVVKTHEGAWPRLDWDDERTKYGLTGEPVNNNYIYDSKIRAQSLRQQVACYYLCPGTGRKSEFQKYRRHLSKYSERQDRAELYKRLAGIVENHENARGNVRTQLLNEFNKMAAKCRDLERSIDKVISDSGEQQNTLRLEQNLSAHREVLYALESAMNFRLEDLADKVRDTFTTKASRMKVRASQSWKKATAARNRMREMRNFGKPAESMDVQELDEVA